GGDADDQHHPHHDDQKLQPAHPMNPGSHEIVIEGAAAGERLDRALTRTLPAFSRSRLKALIEAGQVSVAGAAVRDPALKVRDGQIFVVFLPDLIEPA